MPDEFGRNISAMLETLGAALDRADRKAGDALAGALLSSPAVFTAGAGRSGLVLRCMAMRLMHLGLTVHISGDTATPAIRPGDLLLVASGSGETAGPALLADRAKSAGAVLAVVTASAESSLARKADIVVEIGADPGLGLGVHPMGSLFEESLLLFFDALVLDLMGRTGATPEKMFARHANLE